MQENVTVEFGTFGDLLIDDSMIKNFDCTPKDKDANYISEYSKINDFLINQADEEQKNAFAVTNVMLIDGKIAGFYVLQMGVTKVSKKYRHNNPNFHGVKNGNVGYPCVDVPKLAIDSNYQGKGLGRILLKHLMLNVYWQVVPVIGGCLITLDSLNPAKDFYSKFGFKEYSQENMSKTLTAMACLSNDIETVLSISDGVPDPSVADEINSIADTLPIFSWESPNDVVVKNK